MIFSKEIDAVLKSGFFLEKFGIKNWVFDSQRCLISINGLRRIGVAILGVDTFFEGALNPTGDILFCDRKENEADADYLERSTTEAITFVSNPIYYDFKFILIPDTHGRKSDVGYCTVERG